MHNGKQPQHCHDCGRQFVDGFAHCLIAGGQAAVTEQTTHTYGARIMLRHSHLQPHRLAHAPTRVRLALVASAALACTLCAGLIATVATAQPSPQTPPREPLTIRPEEAMQPWTGDLDGMIERGQIRVLTVYSKTYYFVTKGIQRGMTYD